MYGLLIIAYLILGLFQLAAVMAGLEQWFGLPALIAAGLSLVIAYTPLLGTVLGITGAVSAWGWSFPMAVALFLGPFLVVAALSLYGRIDRQ